jgi:hypothetical protein
MTVKRSAILAAAALGLGYIGATTAFGASQPTKPEPQEAAVIRPAATMAELNPCASGACW